MRHDSCVTHASRRWQLCTNRGQMYCALTHIGRSAPDSGAVLLELQLEAAFATFHGNQAQEWRKLLLELGRHARSD